MTNRTNCSYITGYRGERAVYDYTGENIEKNRLYLSFFVAMNEQCALDSQDYEGGYAINSFCVSALYRVDTNDLP